MFTWTDVVVIVFYLGICAWLGYEATRPPRH